MEDAYDGWGNLTREWQSLTAGQAVNTSSTPSVQYTYADGSGGLGVAQFVRPTVVTYPNGRQIDYNYAAGVDSVMSRITSIQTAGESTPNAAYSYLGADQIVTEDYQQPQIKLDYSAGSHQRLSSNFGNLDQFGRVVDQIWSSYGSASGNVGTVDGYGYTYDAASNRLTDTYLLAPASALSEMYVYDKIDRLTSATRSNGQSQTWTLDSLGNIISSLTNGTNQTETVNSANEIQSLSGAATPGYDLAGNMTTTLEPGFAEHRADGRVRRLESVGECVGRFGQRYLPVRRLGPVGG